MADDKRRRNKTPSSSSSPVDSVDSGLQSGLGVPTSTSSGVSLTRSPQTNSDIPTTSERRPFASSSYKSRYSQESLSKSQNKPTRRKSIFVEELNFQPIPDVHTVTSTSAIGSIQALNTQHPPIPHSRNSLSYSNSPLSVNPSKAKESYIMQLPIQPIRFSVLLLVLVAFTTVSLSISAEGDLDGLLRRVPGDDVMEKRQGMMMQPIRHDCQTRIRCSKH